MGKSINLTRNELVWQTRCNSWDESDFKNLLNWLKGFEGKEGGWARDHYNEYQFLSAYTWDEICRYFDVYDEDEPTMAYYDENGEKRYTTCISELIKEYMREENYDQDICNEDYADDYDEQWDIQDYPAEEMTDEQ